MPVTRFAAPLAATAAALALLTPAAAQAPLPRSVAASPDEPRLANLRQLTDGGENAEAYWSTDGTRLIFQATRPGESACDQIYTMDPATGATRRVSNGRGRTTCGYWFPGGDRLLYASTHHVSDRCPAPPDRSQGYVWALFDYDIFAADADGSNVRPLAASPGYDAEATIGPDGRVVFTSDRDGDLELYVMDADGSNVRRLTHEPGYDGGAFFSADGKRIVYRAHHPATEAELADYRRLLSQRLIRPGQLEIWVMDADGSNRRQVTNNGAANFAPFFHPDGKRILFSSNLADPRGRDFDLFLINVDGTGLERVTRSAEFDGFPMFSPDGTKLVFGSNRGASRPGDTNLFVAEWVENPVATAPTSGYGAYLGTIPAFGEAGGVTLQGVREGSPAAAAGLMAGDVLIAFDGVPIADLQAMTNELRARRAGDAMRITYRRGGQEASVRVTLGTRN